MIIVSLPCACSRIRHAFHPLLYENFLRQSYEPRELIVIDTGSVSRPRFKWRCTISSGACSVQTLERPGDMFSIAACLRSLHSTCWSGEQRIRECFTISSRLPSLAGACKTFGRQCSDKFQGIGYPPKPDYGAVGLLLLAPACICRPRNLHDQARLDCRRPAESELTTVNDLCHKSVAQNE